MYLKTKTVHTLVLASLTLSPFWALALTDEEANQEIEFATQLIDLGFSDFAINVAEAVGKERPDQKDRIYVVEAQILIRKGKFDEASELAKKLPNTSAAAQAINLKLANAFFSRGEVDKAKGMYTQFFSAFPKVPTDADLKKAYIEAAYSQSQMLLKSQDFSGAVKAFDRVLSANPEAFIVRSISLDKASALVAQARTAKAAGPFKPKVQGKPTSAERAAYAKTKPGLLQAAEALCNEITFGKQDLTWGGAIGVLADIKLVAGDRKGAVEIVDDYYDALSSFDEVLKETGIGLAESPLARLRYFRGERFFEDAQASFKDGQEKEAIGYIAKAATELYNVFLKYGESDFGPKAGLLYSEADKLLNKETGKNFKVQITPEQRSMMAQGQIRFADELYRAKNYDEAREKYLEILNTYPEANIAPGALYNLAVCYAEANDVLMVRVLSRYLSERFVDEGDTVGNSLLRLGKFYTDKKMQQEAKYFYEDFSFNFVNHDKAPQVLFLLAENARKNGDTENAERYRGIIKEKYPNDSTFQNVLNRDAYELFSAENYEASATAYAELAAAYTPGYEKAEARFYEAFSYGKQNNFKGALKSFNALKKDLEAPAEDNPYLKNADARFAALKEKVTFHFANFMSSVDKDDPLAEKLYPYAITTYNEYLTAYPTGDFAPQSMYSRGKIELLQGKFEDATKTFNELAAEYPDSQQGKSALFSLVKAAIEGGQAQVARDAVKRMLEDSTSYGANEFVRVGMFMMDNEFFDEAQQALEIVKSHPDAQDNDAILQRALFGLGRSNFEQGNCSGAINHLEEMLVKYPKSALLFDIYLLMADSYVCEENFSKARETLREVSILGSKVNGMEADLRIAKIQVLEGEKESALASLMRIGLFGDASKPEQVELIGNALNEASKLAKELGKWTQLKQIAESYITNFPSGPEVDKMRKYINEAAIRLAE